MTEKTVAFSLVLLGVMSSTSLSYAGAKEQTLNATVMQSQQAAPASAAGVVQDVSKSAEAQATDNTGFGAAICTNDGNKRLVTTTTTTEGGCEVHYKKETEQPGHDQVLWSARNQKGFCEVKAQEFVEKLKAWGWSCAKS